MKSQKYRMCRLKAHSANSTECCGHVLLDLLIAPWFGGVPANYGAFAKRACVHSVGLIVHGNEFETNITFLLMHVHFSRHPQHTHTRTTHNTHTATAHDNGLSDAQLLRFSRARLNRDLAPIRIYPLGPASISFPYSAGIPKTMVVRIQRHLPRYREEVDAPRF